jgi:hypothetical protein
MNWQDNLLLEGDDPGLAERGQTSWQCTPCTLVLSAGHTIQCKSIKGATIEQYLLAVVSFFAQFSGTDFRKDRPTDVHMGRILAPVLRDIKSFDTIPDRGEPYDPHMHLLGGPLVSCPVPAQ